MAINYTKTRWRNGQPPALNETNLNHLEDGVKAACDGVDKIAREKLWENASPTSAFSAQTISLDLSGYDAVEIYARTDTDINSVESNRCAVGGHSDLHHHNLAPTYFATYQRNVAVNTSGISFGDSVTETGTASVYVTENNKMIPQKIYGIKEV